MTWLIGLALRAGVPARFAKFAVIGVLVLLAIALFFGAKALYDSSIIDAHETKQELKTIKADRKADSHAEAQRTIDDARHDDETAEVKEAINEAQLQGRDPRAAYYDCVVRQQSARKQRQPSPDC